MKPIATTWQLTKSSLRVLRVDRKLMVLPVMWALTIILAVLAFGGLVLIAGGLESSAEEPGLWLLVATGYAAVSTVGVFFKAALAFGAHERLIGGDPTIGSALRGAASRLPRLSRWAPVACLVGLLGIVREQLEADDATAWAEWQILTYLVIPVMVIEDIGPIKAFSRMDDFGDVSSVQVVALAAFSLLTYFLVIVPGVVVLVVATRTDIDAPIVIGLIVVVCLIAMAAGLIAGVLGVLQAVLYLYASGGEIPAEFTREPSN